MCLNIHSIIPVTRVNGPGNRYAIWLQGCKQKCKGCFNPETHDPELGKKTGTEELFKQITANRDIEGVSFSGGEPFLQYKPLSDLLQKLKKETNLTVLIYTGFTFEQIIKNNEYQKLLQYTDILIAGPFIENQQTDQPLLSSANQTIHLLTNHYSFDDLDTGDVEIFIEPDGTITITGHNNFTI